MDDESGVTESTWPDLSEQNAVFDGKEVPRRLSLALGDASLNHQVPKIVVKPIKNGTFDPVRTGRRCVRVCASACVRACEWTQLKMVI